MDAEAILARLQGIRRNGSGWIARCPAHADKRPSLSLREESGKVLLHCFAGCTVESICAALRIRVGDLFTEPRERRTGEPRILRDVEKQLAGLRGRLTPRDRKRAVTVVLASEGNLDAAIARALALAVEEELVQVALVGSAQ